MAADEHKAVVRRFIEEVGNQRKLAVIDEIVAEEYRQHALNGGVLQSAPQVTGRAALRHMVSKLLGAAFPDLHFTIDELLDAEGDRVVARFTARGTHTGAPFLGIPPTGKDVTLRAMHIFRLQDGQIIERWTCSDMLSPLQQVGGQVVPPDQTST